MSRGEFNPPQAGFRILDYPHICTCRPRSIEEDCRLFRFPFRGAHLLLSTWHTFQVFACRSNAGNCLPSGDTGSWSARAETLGSDWSSRATLGILHIKAGTMARLVSREDDVLGIRSPAHSRIVLDIRIYPAPRFARARWAATRLPAVTFRGAPKPTRHPEKYRTPRRPPGELPVNHRCSGGRRYRVHWYLRSRRRKGSVFRHSKESGKRNYPARTSRAPPRLRWKL